MFKSVSIANALLVVVVLSATNLVYAFQPSTKAPCSQSSLYMISSWGVKGNPAFRTATKLDPEKHIQDYLPEPGPVEARASGLDGTILVSGLVNNKDRTDQFLFDLLNHEDSAFEFRNITAVCDDAALAKKRLLSRSARYTGLLDKLHVTAATAPGALPTTEQLQGIPAWLAVLEGGDVLQKCQEVAKVAATADALQHVAILMAGVNELSPAACQAAVQAVQQNGDKVQYTIVAVGHLDDTRVEGSAAYQYDTFGAAETALPAKATFSREEAYRLVTELLQLECGANKALVFAEVYNPNVTEAKLIKGLREAGYARPQEIDHMVRLGPQAYQKAIEEFRTANPDAALGYTTDAWWEADEYKLSRQRSDARMAATAQAVKDARTVEIEAIAKEWAKREYFRAAMAGTLENDMTEEDYIQSVWERAMFEGDVKYRQSKGELVDTAGELATFQAQQERKQQVLLQRAKADLARVLQDDDVTAETAKDEEEEDDEDDDDDDE